MFVFKTLVTLCTTAIALKSFMYLTKNKFTVKMIEAGFRPNSHETQYCDKKIKRYCDKKIFLRHGFQWLILFCAKIYHEKNHFTSNKLSVLYQSKQEFKYTFMIKGKTRCKKLLPWNVKYLKKLNGHCRIIGSSLKHMTFRFRHIQLV